jgi:hemerythrin-like domain-containing protein
MAVPDMQRRRLLILAGSAGIGLAAGTGGVSAAERQEQHEEPVTANEDLMREHGIIRRVLLVYREVAHRARNAPGTVRLASLGDATSLFRDFGEDYHERALEEAHIFPVVRKLNEPVARLPDVLQAQHERGREITDYLAEVASRASLGAAATPLAGALESLAHMYEPHAAREDTELFPAWKEVLGEQAYAEIGEQFEEIEHRTFGGDGFDDALERIARIEAELGLSDLNIYTAPPPR